MCGRPRGGGVHRRGALARHHRTSEASHRGDDRRRRRRKARARTLRLGKVRRSCYPHSRPSALFCSSVFAMRARSSGRRFGRVLPPWLGEVGEPLARIRLRPRREARPPLVLVQDVDLDPPEKRLFRPCGSALPRSSLSSSFRPWSIASRPSVRGLPVARKPADSCALDRRGVCQLALSPGCCGVRDGRHHGGDGEVGVVPARRWLGGGP